MVPDLAGRVDAVGVVVGPQVVEACGRVGEQVPDDDQDGARDRDEGFEPAAAFDQAPVALAEEGVRLGRGGSGFTEPLVCWSSARAASRVCRRNSARVVSFSRGGQPVDLIKQHAGDFGVVLVEPAAQRLDQSSTFGFIRPRASSASRRGSRSPAMSASSMSRTERVSNLLATDETLIKASSSSFSSRCQCRVRSRVRLVGSNSRYADGTAARFVEPPKDSNFALAPGGGADEAVRTCALNVVDTYDPNSGVTRVNRAFYFQITGAENTRATQDIGLFVNGGMLPRDDFSLRVSGQTEEQTAFHRTPVTLSGRYAAEGGAIVSGEILHLSARPDDAFNFNSPYLSGEIRRRTDGVENVVLHVELQDMRSTFAIQHGPRLTMAPQVSRRGGRQRHVRYEPVRLLRCQ